MTVIQICKLALRSLSTIAIFNTSLNATIMSVDKLQYLMDYLTRVPELEKFRTIIENNSSAVVLIYSISDKAKNDDYFYNIGLKPRTSDFDYKYGVITGVVISSDGVIVTPYDCVNHANRFIVSIDSDHRTEETYGEISVTKDDFEAKVIKAIPELNLAFLQIVPDPAHASRKFDYLNIANDSVITDGKVKHFLLNGAVAYGKCRGEFFLTERQPRINKNLFTDYQLFCPRISSDIFNGSRRLVIYSPLYPEGVIPELHGGALITLDSTLLGLTIYKKDINAPMSLAIPSSIIKKGMQLAVPWLIKFSEERNLELKVEPLSDKQKQQLVSVVNNWPSMLLTEVTATFPRTMDGEKFGKLQDAIMLGHCGVVVSSIVDGGVSESSGIRRGDIILTVDGVGVTDPLCFYNLEAQSIGSQYVELRVVPLSRRHNTKENILYIPIYKNTNSKQDDDKEKKNSNTSESTTSIINRIRKTIQRMMKKE